MNSYENFIVGENSFEDCFNLSVVHDNAKTKKFKSVINSCSFWNTQLQNISFESVQKIGQFAFFNTKLFSLFLSNTKKIDDYAFCFITSLNQIHIDEFSLIGKTIFWGSLNIKTATISGRYTLNSYFGKFPQIEELKITGTKCVPNFCRDNHILKKVEINCKTIGNWSFYNNSNLDTVKLDVERLGSWTFAYCSSLTEIDIPVKVNYIDMNCFRYCKKLSKIVIHTKERLLFGANAFYSTSNNKLFYVLDVKKYFDNDIWMEYFVQIKEINIDDE